MKKTLRQCLLPVLLGCSGVAQAGLLNPDFSQGFQHWQAAVSWTDQQSGSDATDSGELFGAYPAAFSLSGSNVTLTTALQAQRELWSLLMYQDLQLDAVGPGKALWLQFNLKALLSSSADFYFAQLRDLDTNDVLDLSAGGRFNLTSWIGRNLTLEFGVQDNDFVLGDSLTLSQLQLESRDVPAPASLLLFCAGLLLLPRAGTGRVGTDRAATGAQHHG
jgi:hypothetical protein